MKTNFKMQTEKKWYDIIIRYLSENCTPEEENELLDWINQSVDNEKYFNKFKYAWIASIQLKPVNPENIEKATSDFRLKISQSKNNKNKVKGMSISHPLTLLSKRIFKYAALLLIAFFLGSVSQNFLNKRDHLRANGNDKNFYFEAPRGSRAIATLPDGTKVWLNASSKISYSLDYNVHERSIMLEGEAYFDVTPNPFKPFVVKANNLDIKAFGTLFNVKAYPEENQVITTLLEGKVTIEGNDEANKRFTLKMDPKQCVIYYTDKKTVENPKPEESRVEKKNILNESLENPPESTHLPIVKTTLREPEINTSWKDQRWIIANENLLSLSVMLERRFNVNIKFLNEELKEYHFTGIIQNETIEQVLTILSLTVPVKYEIDLNNIDLVLNQELKNRYMNALKPNTIITSGPN